LSGCCGERTDIDGYCVPLHDGPGNSREYVLAAIDFIAAQVENGFKVLVHCQAGRSRSVCIVAAYLMRHKGFSRKQAISAIAAKRQICLSDGIEEIFKHTCTSKPSLLSCLLLESGTSCLDPDQKNDEIDNERIAQVFFTNRQLCVAFGICRKAC
jgi:hypothetical protein